MLDITKAPSYLQDEVFRQKTDSTLRWAERSIQAGQGGSATYFSLIKGWGLPYPETTGYLIETLFNYANYSNNSKLYNLALQCADWLCDLQQENGAFPGGLGMNGEPLIFDTGQILFGLTRTYLETKEGKYHIIIKKTVEWLLNSLELDGSWQQFAYQKGYTPSYYTKVIYAILYANTILQDKVVTQAMMHALQYYKNKITPQKTIKDWAFAPNEFAYTHTIAYTLEGMLESAYLLKDNKTIHDLTEIANIMIRIYKKEGRLAGRYAENWQGDYHFTCVTGNAQLSIFFTRLYEITKKPIFLQTSINIFETIVNSQWKLPIPGIRGGIPGSKPIWGAYQRFRFPNWAAKFYLDAYLLLKLNTSA